MAAKAHRCGRPTNQYGTPSTNGLQRWNRLTKYQAWKTVTPQQRINALAVAGVIDPA
jgi:hypothetical protein